MNKKPFKANEVGIVYMLAGAAVGSSNTDPYAEAPTSNNQWVEPGRPTRVAKPLFATFAISRTPGRDQVAL